MRKKKNLYRLLSGLWNTAPWAVRDRARLRFYLVSDDSLLHSTTISDIGSYTWSSATASSVYATVEYVAEKWDDAATDVSSRTSDVVNES